MSEPKIYLTEDEDGKPGKRIEAFSLEEADAIAKSWRRLYVCNKCLDNFSYMLTIPVLLSDQPEVVKNGRSCRKCSHIDECRVLVVKNLPVKCEIWDEFDLLALAPAKFP